MRIGRRLHTQLPSMRNLRTHHTEIDRCIDCARPRKRGRNASGPTVRSQSCDPSYVELSERGNRISGGFRRVRAPEIAAARESVERSGAPCRPRLVSRSGSCCRCGIERSAVRPRSCVRHDRSARERVSRGLLQDPNENWLKRRCTRLRSHASDEARPRGLQLGS